MRKAINAVIIENKKLLLVKKNLNWIFPGGKPETGETDLECLCREVAEELTGTKLKDIQHYGDFIGKTPHKEDLLKAKAYFANIDGMVYPVREKDSISEMKWVNDFHNYNLSNITLKIVNSLKEDKYI